MPLGTLSLDSHNAWLRPTCGFRLFSQNQRLKPYLYTFQSLLCKSISEEQYQASLANASHHHRLCSCKSVYIQRTNGNKTGFSANNAFYMRTMV